jgi:predicted Zn-dependent peptidase
MPKFSSVYALFATRYGSVDSTFKTKSDTGFAEVPAGIAHFLEHKLFENEDCDVFKLYAETGASANAFTSFDKTAYLFLCSQKFSRNLEILLDFVQKPYFTDETVAKEQGIIAQEIKMYDDSPEWRVFFNCLENVYHNNPVRINIAGTTETIAQIDKELLYRCYHTFYNLNNMVICIAGNFNPDEALEICDRLLKPSENIELQTIIPDEPPRVKQTEVREKLPVGIPLFQLGFKLPNEYSADKRKYVLYNILFEMMFGDSSAFYKTAYESGLINDTFSVSVFTGRGFFMPVADGEAREPEKVAQAIKAEIRRLKESAAKQASSACRAEGDEASAEVRPEFRGLCEADFKRIKKQTYGELIGALTSVESVASSMMNAEFENLADAYEPIEVAASASFGEITALLAELDEENSCLSIVEN